MPFDSGSKGLSCTILVASVPVNPATPSARRPPRPMPASLSQTSRRGTAPSCSASSYQIPASRSGVVRDGSIRAVMQPRERRHHHQHRRRTGLPAADRDPRRREPQVALGLITGPITQPVSRILRRILRPQQRDPFTEPRRRAGPADPLGQHRRRHRREPCQQHSNARLDHVERRPRRRPAIPRRRLRPQRPRHRLSGQPEPRRDSPRRQTLRKVKMTDLRPLLHPDHPPKSVVGWPTFRRAKLA